MIRVAWVEKRQLSTAETNRVDMLVVRILIDLTPTPGQENGRLRSVITDESVDVPWTLCQPCH
jgi:hypothetical protein